ncbi:UvrD-helicase domain-containing protein [Pelagibacterium luteolum]|uniref:DNA 3'-5' helicase II n=1 Tax=Pelagibacterium luteolum TaxID=440168 RepID=A0A1G7XDX5_9HYPH|nr:UvrD-helicase domain-containing protein [Pelagibacterium luteolum]SDG82409.1 DNA helicase-2 / ATP-dependent DNA helicase PcrA [Pelagibacterium luteolum]
MAIPEKIHKALQAKANGSVVAPAGYGKTETIADIVAGTSDRCLLLTHTLAGVDALRKRLREKGVRSHRYRLETIAAWSLRYAAAYPVTSGFPRLATPRGHQWTTVYAAAQQLLGGYTIDRVIQASYGLILVDEYQDCTADQHAVVALLSNLVPTLIFGDPLQSIFDFGGEATVRWQVDVLPAFPQIDELRTPWRWKNKGNDPLAVWLGTVRDDLQAGRAIDLRRAPACVQVHHLDEPRRLRALERKSCNQVSLSDSNRLAIIASKSSEEVRAALAKRVYAQNVETIECKVLQRACSNVEATTGIDRLKVVMRLLHQSIVGVNRTPFLRRIGEIHGGKQIRKPLTPSETAALAIITSDKLEPVIALLDEFRKGRRTFRGELIFALRESLQLRCLPGSPSLLECAWHVQERRRHAGRRHGYKIVTSTLLAKGLEYENSVVFLTEPATKEDIYVALTRASRRIDIVTAALDLSAK